MQSAQTFGVSPRVNHFAPHDNKGALVEIVKLDFFTYDPATRQEIYKIFRDRKVTFFAEKVETLGDVRTTQAEANSLFQGYFHSRPETIAEAQLSATRSVYRNCSLYSPSPRWMTGKLNASS
jgi:c-di-GMP-related signal transduction protein